MVARLPLGLSASAVFHAAAVSLLVLVPLLGKSSLPDPHSGVVDVLKFPVLLAAPGAPPDSPPRLRRPTPARPTAQTVVLPPPDAPPAIALPEEAPSETDPSAPPCSGCAPTSDPTGVPGGDPLAPASSRPSGFGSAEAVSPIRVGTGVEAPRKVVHVPPRYPELAQRAGIQGTVVLECVIDPTGAVAEVRFVDGPALLKDAALEAVRQWRYKPTKLNGIPVPVAMTVTVRFLLRKEG